MKRRVPQPPGRGPLSSLIDIWKVKSIQFIITASFMLMTLLVMVVVSVLLYDKFARTAEQNAFIGNEQIVEQVKLNVEMYLDGMDQAFKMVDERIRASKTVPDPKLEEQLRTILETRSDVVSMALFTAQGTPLAHLPETEMRRNTRITDQSWFRSAVENPGHVTVSLPHVQNLYKGRYPWVVSMSKSIILERDGVREPAVLLVDFNFKTIDDLLSRVSLGQRGYVYIIDESAGNMVYHPQQQLIYAGLKYENVEQAMKYAYGNYVDDSTGETRLITIQTVNNIGWKMIGVSYMNEIVTAKREIGWFLAWLMLGALVFVLLLSAFMSAKISQPIRRLERSMSKVEQGVFDIHIQEGGEDEVGRLSRRFNLMVARIRELMEQSVKEQEAKRKSELEVLQSQINPHFLYNTLNSVVRLAGSGKSEEVIRMITSLSKFFRISLSKGKSVITVQEELEHVRNYLIIQTMRYKNKFRFEIECEDEVKDCPTVKLILQPVVENAIYHGIEMMVDEGFIRIRAERAGDRVRITVADDGLGMPPEKVKGLLQAEAPENGGPGPGSSSGSGVGIRNVHERIRLMYGEEYGLEIESRLEEGTTVTLWIPYRTGVRGGEAG
ncbi:cache domain-containing sensor histidine kinase [Paenibacillus mucilaginosus]|uniref:histidine kinase n=1 Tax=Paenibacillus mucilaginosus (strain KNP414) TaxID=1036673 RepID=F8FIN8_PAEMK|nr:sensor histidine kinase [Paenibacillus mucilaginosus]AEI45492.1 probable two-component sensor histidine kinase [Paenibacillus mucilaginosus KNP414]MCG7215248.1 sensor histidine kinase [Paenibacillus mucilaginosus]WDM26916.1 sensor histidine kinase [Paenibacillus mucilaginosus]